MGDTKRQRTGARIARRAPVPMDRVEVQLRHDAKLHASAAWSRQAARIF